ncbi:MAG: hypothetical protein P1V97_37950, partial [Planctomycetota bacterium]|nr:hypothetical protein [Planctomycetota bacterium]
HDHPKQLLVRSAVSMSRSSKLFAIFIIMTLSLGPLGCRTLTVEQKQIKARLKEWQNIVEDAEDDPSERAKAWKWAKELNKEKSAAVRAAIVHALPKLKIQKREDVRKLALETLKADPHGMVRLECIEVLALHKSEDVRSALAEILTKRAKTGLLSEDSAEVRAVAARCLGQLGDTNGALPLLIGMKDPVDWVRVQAENSLHKLRGDQVGRSFEEWKRWVRELEETKARKAKEEKEARDRAEQKKAAQITAEKEKEQRLEEEAKQKDTPKTPKE